MSTEYLVEQYNLLLSMNKDDVLKHQYGGNIRNLEDRIFDVLNDSDSISRELCITLLKVCRKYINDDCEIAHQIADNILIKYINDEGILEEYNNIGKWYV